MKTVVKKMFFAGLVIALALAAACSATASPSSAVRAYFRAIEKNDMKALATVATPETVQLMVLFGTLAQTRVRKLGAIRTMLETARGDTATVVVTFENGGEENVSVKKTDGKWLVNVPGF